MSASEEWLRHALSTAPADRPAAEEAIAGLYAQFDRPRPAFVWADSPAAAARAAPPSPTLFSDGPLAIENLLANLVSDLRKQPLGRGIRDTVAGLVRKEAGDQLGLLWYGQHDVDWVAQLRQPGPWATLARTCGWWWPREHVCVIADRPSLLDTEPDADGLPRLHSETGPAVRYRDGWSVHAWHGTRVPAWVIEDPSVEHIARESNVEVRRCAIERLGWAEFIDQAGLRLVSQAADPGNPGAELRLYDLPYARWGSPTRLLLAVNGSLERDGTRRRYGLRVPLSFDDALDAAGWTYGVSGDTYRQLLRRT